MRRPRVPRKSDLFQQIFACRIAAQRASMPEARQRTARGGAVINSALAELHPDARRVSFEVIRIEEDSEASVYDRCLLLCSPAVCGMDMNRRRKNGHEFGTDET